MHDALVILGVVAGSVGTFLLIDAAINPTGMAFLLHLPVAVAWGVTGAKYLT